VTAPRATVVVCCFNGAAELPHVLASLAAQTIRDQVEVLVVDDGSTDGTADVARSYGVHLIVHEQNAGLAAARNTGWRAATAPVVAFTDDDCRPDQRWLANLLTGFEHADIVQGATSFDAAEAAGRGPFSQVVHVERWTGQFETSNVAYRRTLLERLDGFDERFEGDSFGEDVDLGWRAVEGGANTAFAAEAIVVHDVKRGAALDELLASVRAGWRWRHIGRVLHDHPGYRPHRLRRGPFLAATHPPTLVALLGIVGFALAPRVRIVRALALLSLVPWLRHRIVLEPRPGRPRDLPLVLPAAFVVDAVETLTVTASGIRYRTLVL
jgi:glycosyltransferase involved in cell wall biosynthesis